MKPLFIVFEGLDGSGTSTQAKLLADAIARITEQPVKLTSEPSSGPIGQMIRTAMSGRLRLHQDVDKFDRQMAYLFAADRNDHLFNDVDGVMKTISQGSFVISTRYYFSSLAYHCNSESDEQFIMKLNDAFPEPDLVIYIDISVDVSLARLSSRTHLDAYENVDKLTTVHKNYERIFRRYMGPQLKIDGQLSAEEIHETIVRHISGLQSYAS